MAAVHVGVKAVHAMFELRILPSMAPASAAICSGPFGGSVAIDPRSSGDHRPRWAAGIRVVERIDEIPTVVKEKLGVLA